MTHQTPTHVPAVYDHQVLPNQPFFSWLRTQTTLFISQIAALVALVYTLASLIYYLTGEHSSFLLTPTNINVFVDYAHIIFMALFIGVLIRYLDDNDKGAYRVTLVYERVFGPLSNRGIEEPKNRNARRKDAGEERLENCENRLRAFKRRFLLFWIMMLALYVTFICHHTLSRESIAPSTAHQVSQPCQTSGDCSPRNWMIWTNGSWLMASDYGQMARAKADGNYKSDLVAWKDLWRPLFFPALEFVFNNLSLLFVFRCFVVLAFPDADDKARRWGRRGTLVVTLFIAIYVLIAATKFWGLNVPEQAAFLGIFEALSGILNAVVVALLVARLDSKLVGLPSYLISVLYSYAAIQPLFVAFNQGPNPILEKITAAVLVFVLLSKIYFFLIIMYSVQTGRMLNYLFCFPVLRDRAQEAAEQEVLPKQPTRSIRSRNNSMRFLEGSADRVFKFVGPRMRSRIREFRKKLDSLMRDQVIEQVSIRLGWIAIGLLVVPLLGYTVLLGWIRRYSFEGLIMRTAIGLDFVQLATIVLMLMVLFWLRRDNGWGAERALNGKETIFYNAPHDDKYPPKRAQTQIQKIKEYFLWFWGITLAFYVVLTIKHLLGVGRLGQQNPNWDQELTGFVHTVGALAWPALGFILGSVNLLFIFWCYVVVQSPAYDDRSMRRQKLLANYSAFIILLMIAAFVVLLPFVKRTPTDLSTYVTIFDGISGTLSGVAMALLIARMGSKLFGLRQSSIWILFTYAAIQPLFVVFEINAHGTFEANANVFDTIEIAALLAALLLKMCFFLTVLHVLQSGKMMHYFVCFPILKDRTNSIFENQFEIKTGVADHKINQFTFTIWKKNELVYSTCDPFPSRRRCDARIVELRKLMPDFEQKQPDPVEGTYWIEIRDADGELICESIPLRSQTEREELIEQSKQFIPHCKYTRT